MTDEQKRWTPDRRAQQRDRITDQDPSTMGKKSATSRATRLKTWQHQAIATALGKLGLQNLDTEDIAKST